MSFSKRFHPGFCLLLVLLLAGACSTPREQLLLILHTNDMHSWFAPRPGRLNNGERVELGGAPVLAGMIQQLRRENPENLLYLEAGDLFQGTPISTLSEGQASVELMNLLQPDAFAVGNHEFDYGVEAQLSAFEQANFPVLMANVRRKSDQSPLHPADHQFEVSGLKVAVLGLITDELYEMCDRNKLADIELLPTHDVARDWLALQDADLKICLSHCGYRADSVLATQVSGFDLIIGGHSHTFLDSPRQVGDTWISQVGDFGRYLGVDSLWVKPGKGLVRIGGGALPVLADAAPPDSRIAELVAVQEERVNRELAEEIAQLQQDWQLDYYGESNVGNWLAAAIRFQTNSQIGWWNSGGIRKALEAGPLTLRDVWEIAPFGNEILIAELSAAQIRWVFEDEVRQGGMHLQFDGMRVEAAPDGSVGRITVQGQELESGVLYSVALGDYVWGQLLALEGFAGNESQARHTGLIDRDLLISQAREETVISTTLDGRWGPVSSQGGSY